MLHYSKNGKGQTVVLVHGFCENNTCFSKQVFFLKDRFSVITPDLPGFGVSPPADAGIEQMADGIYEILQHEQAGPCIMLGHSMGGYVTLAFAKKYPDALKGLGLLHSTSSADNAERQQKRDQAIRLIREEGGKDAYVRNLIPPLFAPGFSHAETIRFFVGMGLQCTDEGIINGLQAMKRREDTGALLKETSLPVFFAIGRHDQVIPESDLFKQASWCRQSTICYLEESGHMGYVEEPAKANEAILQFAEDCFAS